MLQQQTERRFATEEERLWSLCAQLSGAIAHAEATGALVNWPQLAAAKAKKQYFMVLLAHQASVLVVLSWLSNRWIWRLFPNAIHLIPKLN